MRKRCNRKVWAKVNPISYVLEGVRPTDEAALDKLRLLELTAIEDFAQDKATLQDVQTICAMVNACEAMANMGIGPEAMPAVKAAEQHIKECAERSERTGRISMTSAGIKALREVFQYHDLQRQSISRGEYEKAIKMATNRVRSKAPEVIVL